MTVLQMMIVPVRVRGLACVSMGMHMGLAPVRPPQSPDQIRQSERDKQPSCQVAPRRFDELQPFDRQAHRHPYQTQHH